MRNIYLFQKIFFNSYHQADYKQYIWWIHNQLRKGMPKVILSYAIQAVRDSFPSENHEDTPFVENNDNKDQRFQLEANNFYQF